MRESQFVQDGYAVRLEWGAEGVEAIGPHCAVLVVVDVLAFSTSVDIAVTRGAHVRVAADRAGGRPPRPSELTDVAAGAALTTGSPNGGALCLRAGAHARVLTGCLRNAQSVAQAASALAEGSPVGVIAAGEQWGVDLLTTGAATNGSLRVAIEDQLGAGAVVSALLKIGHGQASPEAALAATTYRAAEPYLGDLLAGCVSGRELAAAGLAADVELAAAVEASDTAPVLVGDRFENAFREA